MRRALTTDVATELDYSALHAIGFATGTALNALLWHMQRGADRANGSASGYQLLWGVAFIWTLGNFLRYTIQLAGADETSVRLAGILAWSCTIVGPLAIGRFLQARVGRSTPAVQGFLVLCVVASVGNGALMIWAATTHALDLDASWYPLTSLYVALMITFIAMVLYVSRHDEISEEMRAPRPGWFGRGVVLLVVIQVSAALLSSEPWLPIEWRAIASLIGTHWTLPWSLLIAVSLAQAHYADVLLKRSLRLLASVSLAALASGFVLQSSQGLPMVATTLGGGFFLMIVPSLVRALNLVVDRMVLRREDYAVAAQVFEQSIRRIGDRQQLFNEVLGTIRSTLRLEANIVEPSQSSKRMLASIPIRAEGHPSYFLEVSGGHHARILMQDELGFLSTLVAHLSRRLDAMHFDQQQHALLMREERLKHLLTEAELKALRTQVDPHFLFNTLNTIADLISSNPEQAERMTERLAQCFRYTLSKRARELSTLDDEFEFARHYLEIERVRFGDRLRVQLSRGDASGSESVPSLLLQPLLENAIRHGLSPLREGGCVSVMAKRDAEYLWLQIDDDGVGLRPDFAERAGVGLQNVRERLATLYSQAARLVIGSRPDGRGTQVTIQVPLHAD